MAEKAISPFVEISGHMLSCQIVKLVLNYSFVIDDLLESGSGRAKFTSTIAQQIYLLSWLLRDVWFLALSADICYQVKYVFF